MAVDEIISFHDYKISLVPPPPLPTGNHQLYCIWLYNSFSLSYRDVEKMMLYRGICVTYEAIRYWCRK